ncbi:hypothetical protein G7Y89_g11972 [Cudoniella acicularis]|uniref:galacturonan 1,4-alpha-galacturonidase n=1 Tax=Cudoniella acicularis TaxID=354080 RepID=A0A8H4RBC6_9HELO|nr:hypothetical protein G7Y89_g11972 [Cudoniella acicularis]
MPFDVIAFEVGRIYFEMKFSPHLILLTLLASLPGLNATSSSPTSLPLRPTPVPSPYNHGRSHYVSPPRTKTCYVTALGGGKDDSAGILSAAKSCNNGGNIALLDAQYTISRPLDLTFLNAVDFIIEGQVSFTPDVNYWSTNSFQYKYQDTALFWQFGGQDVNIYGGGTLNGNGQAWWDAMASDSDVVRPILLGLMGLKGGSVSNLKMKNPPNWFNFVANSSDIIFDSMTLTSASNNSNPAHNSDGWDTYRSDAVTIQNSYVSNNDDCVSFKPNSTNILVQNMQCINSHGISVGSLGQYIGEVDIVENIYIYNASMTTSSDAARIKVWPGISPSSTSTSSGGGSGYVKNVTYNGMHDTSVNYAIELTQCYGQKDLTLCNQYPSSMIIEDILFENFSGTSKKYDPTVGTLVCSSPHVCKNIVAKNINITNPSGKTAKWTCKNVDNSTLSINCA